MNEITHFRNCPALRRVTFWAVDSRWGSLLLLPWNQIEFVDLGGISPPLAFHLLSKCRGLDGLELTELRLDDEDFPPEQTPGPLVSDAKDISITGCDPIPTLFTFSMITLSISCSFVERDIYFAGIDSSPIAHFILRSKCRITSLHLKWVPFTDKQVLSLLQLMPDLKCLSVAEFKERGNIETSNFILTPTLLRHLSVTSDHDIPHILNFMLVPKLTNLTMTIHAGDQEENEALLTMLSTRLTRDEAIGASVEGLQAVSLTVITEDVDRLPDCPFGRSLSSFVGAGMPVKVSYISYTDDSG